MRSFANTFQPSGQTKSTIVPIRLKQDELRMLDMICRSQTGSLNRSEKIRQLLVREFNRRATGYSSGALSGTTSQTTIMSESRIGRPARTADGQSVNLSGKQTEIVPEITSAEIL
jgi:hypothetical protein